MPVGQLIANALLFVLSATQSKEDFLTWGWRIPFLLSAVLVLIGLYVRLAVEESRVFKEAAALGVLHVHLSGGEPGARRALVDIVANAREAGLYTNLITSGVCITTRFKDCPLAGSSRDAIAPCSTTSTSAVRKRLTKICDPLTTTSRRSRSSAR